MAKPSSSAIPVVQPSDIRNSRSAVVIRCRSRMKFAVTSCSTCSASAKISCRRRTRWRSISERCARFSSGTPVEHHFGRIPIRRQFLAQLLQRRLLLVVQARASSVRKLSSVLAWMVLN